LRELRLVDLSVDLVADKEWAPKWARVQVKRQDNKFGRLNEL
jgi:hypothetical protein